LTNDEYENACEEYERLYGELLFYKKNQKFLDIGCGTGHFLYFLMAKGYTNYFGIDISQSQIKFYKKYIIPCCKTADAFEYLKNQKNIYSIISSHDVIEHISPKDVILFLELIYSALRLEAALLLKLPNMSNPFALNNRYRDFTHKCGFAEKVFIKFSI